MFESFVEAKASAKLILSGEHAILYGQPALAMAVNRMVTSTVIEKRSSKDFYFKFLNLNYEAFIVEDVLWSLKRRIEDSFSAFLKNNCAIQDVIKEPFELLLYAFVCFIEKYNLKNSFGYSVIVNSTIPIGCGMGSSAAAIISLLRALSNFYDLKSQEDYLPLGREIERVQHGYTSGLDLYLAFFGGAILWKDGAVENRVLNIPSICLVNSGKPEDSTGVCVTVARRYFRKNVAILGDFADVTLAMDKAFLENDLTSVKESIRKNHRLLKIIGVVPQKVDNFISALEKRGAAAKICGAGASRGQNAGVILAVSEDSIDDLIAEYGYEKIY